MTRVTIPPSGSVKLRVDGKDVPLTNLDKPFWTDPQITKGDPVQQSLGNYAKLTPSGLAGMIQPYDDIRRMGVQPAIKDE